MTDCTIEEQSKLENVQLIFARIVTGAKRGTSHELLYNELAWPKLCERRQKSKLKFILKMFYNSSPDYLIQLLPSAVNENVAYNLRNGQDIRPPRCRLEKFKNSL